MATCLQAARCPLVGIPRPFVKRMGASPRFHAQIWSVFAHPTTLGIILAARNHNGVVVAPIVHSCAWGTQHQTDFCSHVGMLALNSVARFILILICLICACMGVCCYTPAPAQAAAPNIIIQTGAPPQPAMVVAQPVAAIAAAKPQPQPVAVVCPQGCMAGSMIEVNINGQQMSVAVPQGVGPGQQFMVNAPTQP